MEDRFEATVVRSTGSWYEVRDDEGKVLKARIRGRLRLGGSRSTNPVVVGDRVVCTLQETGEVWIEQILARSNYIIRRSSNLSKESHVIGANIDQAVVVATLFQPRTSPEFIDRFLVTCEAYRIPAVILINKMDLAAQFPDVVESFTKIYTSAGYRIIYASAQGGLGVDEFGDYLRGKTTLISGNSGVGKSTLIKAVEPSLDIRIGEISKAHHKGMHTTTFSQMYPLGFGGYIIDTPGIKGFGLIDIDAGELFHYFPELMRVAPLCQYYNCTHVHEPECAVIKAVEDGTVSQERYMSYLKMLQEDGKYRK